MPRTYQAVLHGDRVEWIDRPPTQGQPLAVQITVLADIDARTASERGRAMVEALEALAASDAFAEIGDPVLWQREVRRDRPLVARDG